VRRACACAPRPQPQQPPRLPHDLNYPRLANQCRYLAEAVARCLPTPDPAFFRCALPPPDPGKPPKPPRTLLQRVKDAVRCAKGSTGSGVGKEARKSPSFASAATPSQGQLHGLSQGLSQGLSADIGASFGASPMDESAELSDDDLDKGPSLQLVLTRLRSDDPETQADKSKADKGKAQADKGKAAALAGGAAGGTSEPKTPTKKEAAAAAKAAAFAKATKAWAKAKELREGWVGAYAGEKVQGEPRLFASLWC